MNFWNAAASRWLLVDALLPLFGAAALYLLWGFARFLAARPGKKFSYSWKEALDPMGWLYGASILAIQSATKAAASSDTLVRNGLYSCAGVSLILLLAAMTNRGDDSTWKPKPSFQWIAILVIAAILTAGYAAHFTVTGVVAHPVATTGGDRSE